jgi:hypothetical protein
MSSDCFAQARTPLMQVMDDDGRFRRLHRNKTSALDAVQPDLVVSETRVEILLWATSMTYPLPRGPIIS